MRTTAVRPNIAFSWQFCRLRPVFRARNSNPIPHQTDDFHPKLAIRQHPRGSLSKLFVGMEFEKYEPVPENVAETIQAKK